MTYVYILKSLVDSSKRYFGITSNLKRRMHEHNYGHSCHTTKYLPWQLETYIAFRDKQQAVRFEKYLKTGSGKAFSKKRL